MSGEVERLSRKSRVDFIVKGLFEETVYLIQHVWEGEGVFSHSDSRITIYC